MAKQMVDFQKNLFDNAFNAVCTVQDQTEEMVNMMLKQMAWIPEESKDSVKNWAEMYKNARENYKKSVETGFEKLEEIFSAHA